MTLRKARLSLAAGHYERQEMVVSDLKNMQVSRQGIEYPVLWQQQSTHIPLTQKGRVGIYHMATVCVSQQCVVDNSYFILLVNLYFLDFSTENLDF